MNAAKWEKVEYTFTDEYYQLTDGFFRATISHSNYYGYLLGIETVEGLVCLTPNMMIDQGISLNFKNLRKMQSLGRRLLKEYNDNRNFTLSH